MRVSVDFNDNRSTNQRFLDRSNALNTLKNGISDAWETATTHNANLNRAGNAAEAVNAAISGVGSLKDAGFEAIGANDAYQGIEVLKAVGGMEALRALPPAAQLQAVAGLTSGADAYDGAVAGYNNWAARNPNAAMVAGAVVNAAEQAISKKGTNGAGNVQNTHDGGRNDKHQNLKARQSAAEKLEKTQQDL